MWVSPAAMVIDDDDDDDGNVLRSWSGEAGGGVVTAVQLLGADADRRRGFLFCFFFIPKTKKRTT